MTTSPERDPAMSSKKVADRLENFACPVCRAKQTAQPECRRCNADLALYLKALRSVEESRQQLEMANVQGDSELAEQASAYMRWLTRSS